VIIHSPVGVPIIEVDDLGWDGCGVGVATGTVSNESSITATRQKIKITVHPRQMSVWIQKIKFVHSLFLQHWPSGALAYAKHSEFEFYFKLRSVFVSMARFKNVIENTTHCAKATLLDVKQRNTTRQDKTRQIHQNTNSALNFQIINTCTAFNF
jgi:hypothetical protein